MNRRIRSLKLYIACLVLGLVLQQSCGQHNTNAYDDYDEDVNLNNRHPFDNQPQYGAPQAHYEPQDSYPYARGEMNHQPKMQESPQERTEYQDPRVAYQPYQEERTPYSAAPSQDPRVYQPYPEQTTTPPQDPNVIMVPRLGLVRGQRNFKLINNRVISAYLGLKYGTVRPGLGRFQVCYVLMRKWFRSYKLNKHVLLNFRKHTLLNQIQTLLLKLLKNPPIVLNSLI